MENLEVYIIKKCQYCILLKKLLNEFKIKHLLINVEENKKQEYKNKNIRKLFIPSVQVNELIMEDFK
jgi:glutaredoxin